MTLRSSHTTLEQRQPHAVVPGPQKVAVAAAGGPFPGGADVALDGPPPDGATFSGSPDTVLQYAEVPM